MNAMPSFRPPSTAHLLCDLAIHAVHRELRPVYRLTETARQPRAAWTSCRATGWRTSPRR